MSLSVLSVLLLSFAVWKSQGRSPPQPLLKTVVADWTLADATETTNAFTPIFADYNAASAEDGLFASIDDFEPSGANITDTRGYHFVVSNRADDAYFGLKGRVTGLPRSTKLRLEFDVTIASNVGSDCFGIGGSPGSSVWLKAGASRTEPYTRYDVTSSTWRLAGTDKGGKGDQAMSGPAGGVVGIVGVEDGPCGEEGAAYSVKRFARYRHTNPATKTDYTFNSASDGSLWLLVGFESGYEGFSSLYIQKIVARIYRV